MKISERITTYKQSKKLKRLGINQDLKAGDYFYCDGHNGEMTGFCYGYHSDDDRLDYLEYKNYSNHNSGFYQQNNCLLNDIEEKIKAFDGSQIDNMLPLFIGGYSLKWISDINSKFYYQYQQWKAGNSSDLVNAEGATHIEAKTNLLIKLLENNIISLS